MTHGFRDLTATKKAIGYGYFGLAETKKAMAYGFCDLAKTKKAIAHGFRDLQEHKKAIAHGFCPNHHFKRGVAEPVRHRETIGDEPALLTEGQLMAHLPKQFAKRMRLKRAMLAVAYTIQRSRPNPN
jgi:hypothetical protein